MVNARELIYPTKFKIILFLLLLIPCVTFFIIILDGNNLYYSFRYFSNSFITANPLGFIISISISLLLGLILSYLLGCLIDHYIQNEKIKITIAIISGVISLIVIYAIYKMVTEPIICDPVHLPTNNQTICDPVHQPNSGERLSTNALDKLSIDKSAVQKSLEECISNLNN